MVDNPTDEPCHSVNLADAPTLTACFGRRWSDQWMTWTDGGSEPAAKAWANCPNDASPITCEGVEAYAEGQEVSCQRANYSQVTYRCGPAMPPQ